MGTHSDVLKSSELFGAVSDDVIDDLATSMKLVGLQRRETLFREGSTGTAHILLQMVRYVWSPKKLNSSRAGQVSVLVNMH